MPVEVVMPRFGLTMQEGTIQQWFKAEGDAVATGDALFEVETEKVLYEVEAPASGTVARLLYPTEATVDCAQVVAVIALPGENPAVVAARYAAAAAPAHGDQTAAAGPPAPAAARATDAPATPAARKLARERGVDLATVRGTGPGGRITREDVVAAAAPATAAAAGRLRGMRRSIAERMLHSLHTTAQLTITTEADVTTLVARYRRLRAAGPLTYTDLIVQAAARALRRHPRLNAGVRDERAAARPGIHVGVAVALDEGLVVPVICDADRKSLRQLAQEARALAEKARAGGLGIDDVSGGTFTVTNLGTYGVDAFTPILHASQAAILGVGRIIEKPAVHAGQIVPRSMLTLSLTFDHCLVDGAPAAAFLQSLVAELQVEADDAPPPSAPAGAR